MRRTWTMAMLAAGLAAPAWSADMPMPDFAAPRSDARMLALAGAGTAAAAGASAVWWNPAGLADGPICELLLAHVSLLPGLTHQSGVFSLRPTPGGKLAFAVQADLLREAGVAVPEVAPGLSPTPPHAGYRAALHVAGDIGHGVALGAAVGRLRGLSGMPDPGPRLVGDAGLLWRRAGTHAGLAMRGASLDGASGRPPLVAAGVAQSFASLRVLGCVQLDRDSEGELHPSSGLEWQALPGFVLRAGARYEDAEQGTSGSGGFRLFHDRVRLDYAVQAVRGSSAVHALTLGFDLGAPAALPAPADPAARAATPPAPPVETAAPPVPSAQAPTRPTPPTPLPAPPAPAAEDRSPRPPRREVRPAPSAPRPDERLTVVSGPYPSLDVAAAAILKLRRIELRPTVRQRGEEYFLVLERGLPRVEAETLQALAGKAGVRTTLVTE